MSDLADHEHVFPEEREPTGRLILAPCLSCGMNAMDALDTIRAERDSLEAEAAMWSRTSTDLAQFAVSHMTPEQVRNFEQSGELPASPIEAGETR